MYITDRDSTILEILAFKVRLLSFQQISKTFWNLTKSGTSNAQKRLKKLVSSNLLNHYLMNTRPLIPIKEPIFSWNVDDPEPDFESIALKTQSRWTLPPQITPVYTISKKASNLLGGIGGKLEYPLHITHDLHVSSVYLHLLLNDKDTADCWIGEVHLPKKGFKFKAPDAMINYKNDRGNIFIEFCEKYNAQRIRDFHNDCVVNKIGYQLW